MEKTVAEVPLIEAVKPDQLEQQRRQEAVVQKDRVSASSGFYLCLKTCFYFNTTIRPCFQNCIHLIMHRVCLY